MVLLLVVAQFVYVADWFPSAKCLLNCGQKDHHHRHHKLLHLNGRRPFLRPLAPVDAYLRFRLATVASRICCCCPAEACFDVVQTASAACAPCAPIPSSLWSSVRRRSPSLSSFYPDKVSPVLRWRMIDGHFGDGPQEVLSARHNLLFMTTWLLKLKKRRKKAVIAAAFIGWKWDALQCWIVQMRVI